jgi:DNA-binding NtrC family response regulator
LTAYDWPGNGRELRNVIERALMLSTGDTITAQDLTALLPKTAGQASSVPDQSYLSLPYMEAKERAIEEFTKAYLLAKLVNSNGIITKAAESSGIPRQHFSLLMKRFLGSEVSSDE